jgi:hypothetical protein
MIITEYAISFVLIVDAVAKTFSDEMIAVRWDKPGSRHHNVVHKDLVRQVHVPGPPDSNRAIVLWPRKGKKDSESGRQHSRLTNVVRWSYQRLLQLS